MASPATDVHQHLWPAAFIEALRSRQRAPRIVGWTLYLDGEPPYEITPSDHDAAIRAALAPGFQRIAVSLSSPLGIEYLDPSESTPLLAKWHRGAARFGAPYEVWASINHVEPDLDDLRQRLTECIGLQVPAGEMVTPEAIDRLAPVLRIVEEAGRAVLVHPGVVPGSDAAGARPGWWPAVVDYTAQLQAAWWSWYLAGRSLLPGLRICFVAGAGLAPLQHERFLARGGGALRHDGNAFVDTSSYGRQALRSLIEALGTEVVVMGTDRPYAEPTDPELGPDVTDAIRVRNPARLLG